MYETIFDLKEQIKEQEEYIKYWQNEYDKKCEVIEKAIEYIEKNKELDYLEYKSCYKEIIEAKYLLKILKGE